MSSLAYVSGVSGMDGVTKVVTQRSVSSLAYVHGVDGGTGGVCD